MRFLVKVAGNEAEFCAELYASLWVHEFDIKKLLEIIRRCGGYIQVDYDYSEEQKENAGDGNDE